MLIVNDIIELEVETRWRKRGERVLRADLESDARVSHRIAGKTERKIDES